MFSLTAEQVQNILIFLDRTPVKGFKESKALTDLYNDIKRQERAIMEEKGGA